MFHIVCHQGNANVNDALHLVEWPKSRTLKTANGGKDVQLWDSHSLQWEYEMVQLLWKTIR